MDFDDRWEGLRFDDSGEGLDFLSSANFPLEKNFRIKGRIQNCKFLRIFAVAFLLLLAPTEGSIPAGQSLPNLT